MENKITVSVCMATYNGAHYVRAQLESILKELNDNAEVIVADDLSLDNTLEIVESFKDSRIKILRTKNHLGPVYNFERAIRTAKGAFIFLADQDDIWLEGKVNTMLFALKDYSLVMHDAYILKKDALDKKLSSVRPYKKGILKNWFKNSYTGCCMAFKRELLDFALPFPKSLPMHDQWLGLVAEKKFNVRYIDLPLIQYRIHENNATSILNFNPYRNILKKIFWRASLLLPLCRL